MKFKNIFILIVLTALVLSGCKDYSVEGSYRVVLSNGEERVLVYGHCNTYNRDDSLFVACSNGGRILYDAQIISFEIIED